MKNKKYSWVFKDNQSYKLLIDYENDLCCCYWAYNDLKEDALSNYIDNSAKEIYSKFKQLDSALNSKI